MRRFLVSVFLFTSGLMCSGCVTIVDATTSGPIKTDPGKRSLGDKWDDGQISTIVAVNIRKASPELDQAHINVHTFNQVVLLTGELPSKAAYELAGKTARSVSRVRQVYNETQIRPQSGFLARTGDNFLAIKINTKLLANRDIDSSRVKVIVEDETVYLMGMMTMIQAERITDVVSTTSGVRKVVRAIEYVE